MLLEKMRGFFGMMGLEALLDRVDPIFIQAQREYRYFLRERVPGRWKTILKIT